MANHADRLLARIRAGVAELQRLERTGTDELELRRRRRTIAKQEWQLALRQPPPGRRQPRRLTIERRFV
jgi:hypothetical protein